MPTIIKIWLGLTVLVSLVIVIRVFAQSGKEDKVVKILMSIVIGAIASGIIVGIGSVATHPVSDEEREEAEITHKVESAPIHMPTDSTVIGIVTENGDKVVVTAKMLIKRSPNDLVFSREKYVNYEIETDADLQIGDEIAITRGVDGVFKYAGKASQ